MKMKLKFSAIQILLAELQPIEMGAIYLMGAGSEEIPDTVTKRILMNIIIFLCEKLDWIERRKIPSESLTVTFSEGNNENILKKSSKNLSNDIGVNDKTHNNKSEIRLFKKEIMEALSETETKSVVDEVPSNSNDVNTYYTIEMDDNSSIIKAKGFSDTKCGKKLSDDNVDEYIENPNLSLPRIGDKPYSCSQCDYKCSTSSHLKTHEKIHTGDKLFSCSICDKKFTQKSNLKTHQRIHTGDKPFSCLHCDKKFTQKVRLEIHQRIHTGDKPYSCSLCDYQSSDKGTLSIHERTHTGHKPFSCSLCNFRSSRSSGLKIHERIHTGDKPFNCWKCDYKCSDKRYLRQHETIHTGEKPFSCLKCDYKCARSSHLKNHERRIHNT